MGYKELALAGANQKEGARIRDISMPRTFWTVLSGKGWVQEEPRFHLGLGGIGGGVGLVLLVPETYTFGEAEVGIRLGLGGTAEGTCIILVPETLVFGDEWGESILSFR